MAGRDLLTGYIDEIARFAFQEFNMLRVAQDQVDDLATLDVDAPLAREKWRLRDVIRDRIAAVKRDHGQQVEVLADAARRGVPTEAAIDAHLDELLSHDVFYRATRESARPSFRDAMAGYFADAYDGYGPLFAHDADDSWTAVRDVYTAEEAEAALATPFTRAPILEDHRDAIELQLDRDDSTILVDDLEYTDEMIRIFDHGEDYVQKVIAADVERAYG